MAWSKVSEWVLIVIVAQLQLTFTTTTDHPQVPSQRGTPRKNAFQLGDQPERMQISPIGVIPKKNKPGKWRLNLRLVST